MGVAALVLGITSLIVAFIPVCGVIALLPALVGLVLGVIDTMSKHKKAESKGMGIAGISLNGLALVVIVVWVGLLGLVGSQSERYISGVPQEWEEASEDLRKGLEEAGQEWEKTFQEMQRESRPSDD